MVIVPLPVKLSRTSLFEGSRGARTVSHTAVVVHRMRMVHAADKPLEPIIGHSERCISCEPRVPAGGSDKAEGADQRGCAGKAATARLVQMVLSSFSLLWKSRVAEASILSTDDAIVFYAIRIDSPQPILPSSESPRVVSRKGTHAALPSKIKLRETFPRALDARPIWWLAAGSIAFSRYQCDQVNGSSGSASTASARRSGPHALLLIRTPESSFSRDVVNRLKKSACALSNTPLSFKIAICDA